MHILTTTPLMVELYRADGYVEALIEVEPCCCGREPNFYASLEDGTEVELTTREAVELAAELRDAALEART